MSIAACLPAFHASNRCPQCRCHTPIPEIPRRRLPAMARHDDPLRGSLAEMRPEDPLRGSITRIHYEDFLGPRGPTTMTRTHYEDFHGPRGPTTKIRIHHEDFSRTPRTHNDDKDPLRRFFTDPEDPQRRRGPLFREPNARIQGRGTTTRFQAQERDQGHFTHTHTALQGTGTRKMPQNANHTTHDHHTVPSHRTG